MVTHVKTAPNNPNKTEKLPQFTSIRIGGTTSPTSPEFAKYGIIVEPSCKPKNTPTTRATNITKNCSINTKNSNCFIESPIVRRRASSVSLILKETLECTKNATEVTVNTVKKEMPNKARHPEVIRGFILILDNSEVLSRILPCFTLDFESKFSIS